MIKIMPSRNAKKYYLPDTHYHVYNRGVNGMKIFRDQEDYAVYLNYLRRHLDPMPARDPSNRALVWLYDDIELTAFCLMPNHFHLLFHQLNERALPLLMKSVNAAYSRYFNKKYNRYGPLFQGIYKASMIVDESYLQHISRYIHLNPAKYREYEWSSWPYYIGQKHAEWLKCERILGMFDSLAQYINFHSDYIGYKKSLDDVKRNLADY